MTVILTMLAGVAVIAGFFACFGFAISGALELLIVAVPRVAPRRQNAAVFPALLKLAGAAALAAIPWLAASIAYGSTGWIDRDHDGMLDGFANGAYDWMDINGGAWIRAAGFLAALVLGAVVVGTFALRRSFEIRRSMLAANPDPLSHDAASRLNH